LKAGHLSTNNLYIEAYKNREVDFQYRKRTYTFSLSHGLFSSAGIDTGSRFLLKVFSDFLDSRYSGSIGCDSNNIRGAALPITILDSGSGAGVLGICAAGALSAIIQPEFRQSLPCGRAFQVRAQDRDELARLFTEYNAQRNGLKPEEFSAHTEPLLAGPGGWDFTLTNIPAKAGLPVLEDFIRRSASLLKKDGRVFLVVVNTLADFFRSGIAAAAALIIEETGKEHTVFVFGAPDSSASRGETKAVAGQDNSIILNENFPQSYPFYIRYKNEYEMGGISYSMDTVHGAPDFDSPGGAAAASAKLALKIDLAGKLAARQAAWQTANCAGQAELPAMIHDAGQGHFALWLAHYMAVQCPTSTPPVLEPLVLSGRNIVALASARAALSSHHNPEAGFPEISPAIIPCADIFLERERLAADGKNFSFIAFFPETVPETSRQETDWEALSLLCAPGGMVFAGMSSMEAERFDRKKPVVFVRAGDVKRKGFRAMAYLKRQVELP